MTQNPGEFKPSRRDKLRPAEYVGGAAIAAIFTGVVVLVTARELTLALIVAGIVFIVVLVVLALLSMAIKPNADEVAEINGDEPNPGDAPGDGGPAAPNTPGH
ncbi:hypothetical protein [Agromyces badenianii]|uniref:hypothetical protein n=1 Tax=Agromyces badenianii TaxID=2080742 RepID=UPI00196B4E6B|nr:hypothetical protein [Agromyces badenianii]